MNPPNSSSSPFGAINHKPINNNPLPASILHKGQFSSSCCEILGEE
jgi:hypothetical protein